MCDKEFKDLARREKKNTPQKTKSENKVCDDDKENDSRPPQSCRKSLDLTGCKVGAGCEVIKAKLDENKNSFDHPVYKEIARYNGQINRSDLSTMKHMCRMENIDSSGKRDLVKQRLKNHVRNRMLREVGLLKPSPHRGYDFFLVIDFEATCEGRNLTEYPHEIIEFPGVLVDGRTGQLVDSWREFVKPVINSELSEFCISLTGIRQETVDLADTFPKVLDRFNAWLETHSLGLTHTFALVTDGPFDVGRFLRLACHQTGLAVPVWAERWVNLRKGFANFYKASTTNHLKLPGLQTMLDKLDLEFEGNPHSGLDDAKNIARVVSRMVADGAVLKVNERLEADPVLTDCKGHGGRPRLQHVMPVSRTQAELWFSECRNKLVAS